MELTIHALSHSYGDKKALTGFTHTFAPGITALLGPNGAGKSTLIHLICDLLPRQTGTIAFDGTDILSMGPAFRQVLGFMPQSQGMYDDMTAWEFLLYMAQLKGLRPRAAREQLRELLQVVNLWDAAHRRGGGAGAGYRRAESAGGAGRGAALSRGRQPSAKPSVTVSQPPAFCRIAGSSMLKTAAALITPAAKPMQGPSSF